MGDPARVHGDPAATTDRGSRIASSAIRLNQRSDNPSAALSSTAASALGSADLSIGFILRTCGR